MICDKLGVCPVTSVANFIFGYTAWVYILTKNLSMIKQVNQEKSDHREFQKQSGMLANEEQRIKGHAS